MGNGIESESASSAYFRLPSGSATSTVPGAQHAARRTRYFALVLGAECGDRGFRVPDRRTQPNLSRTLGRNPGSCLRESCSAPSSCASKPTEPGPDCRGRLCWGGGGNRLYGPARCFALRPRFPYIRLRSAARGCIGGIGKSSNTGIETIHSTPS